MNINDIVAWAIAKKNERKIALLQTGDLIKIKSDYYPFVSHYGIVDIEDDGEIYILHNQPDKLNSKGGGTIREPLRKWIYGREIVEVESTGLSKEEIQSLYEGLKPFKYDFFHFNCEHFVNFAKNGAYLSPQVIRYTSIAIVGLLAFWYFKKRNNGAN